MRHFHASLVRFVAVLTCVSLLFVFGAFSNPQQIIQQHHQKSSTIRTQPNCYPSIWADSGAGGNPGVSIGMHVYWSCSLSGTYTFFVGYWGNSDPHGTACCFGRNGSAIFYHTWHSTGYYTVTWQMWYGSGGGGGNHLEGTAYTYVSIH